jgi:nicotinamidase-related amidase
MTHPSTLTPERTTLLVVDVQERFRAAIAGFESMLSGCVRLVRAFRILDLPIVVTEQYPKGLGKTVRELVDALASPEGGGQGTGHGESGSHRGGEGSPLEKTAFSACGAPGFFDRLGPGLRSVLVCGIEAHVCVSQSVHDLLGGGHAVHLAVDAVGSRRESDRDIALRKMERSGAILTTTEAAAFELLRDARHPRFKDVQVLFK